MVVNKRRSRDENFLAYSMHQIGACPIKDEKRPDAIQAIWSINYLLITGWIRLRVLLPSWRVLR